MRRVLIAAVLILALAAPARADKVLINAVQANTTSSVYAVGPATSIIISVKSAAGSVCTVTIEQKLPSDTTYFTVATITNPSATGEVWKGAGGGVMRVVVSGWISGTVTVNGEAWAGMNQLF